MKLVNLMYFFIKVEIVVCEMINTYCDITSKRILFD